MKNVIIVGGGAAGMMASIFAARNGDKVTLIEKNEKLGKKIFITGKGRCNITNACDVEDLFQNVVTNKEFLYSGFYCFTNDMVMKLMEELECNIKVERGNRVFPVSDHSSDVIKALEHELKRQNVKIMLHTICKELIIDGNEAKGVLLDSGRKLFADKVVIATGGVSYPSTGSTGDGYKFARNAGHKVTQVTPALVPFNIDGDICPRLQGLSLRNIRVTVYADQKKIYEDFGELLFTHFGVSGPVIISASSFISKYKGKDLIMKIDLKAALTKEQLDQRILRDFKEMMNKEFKNSLGHLLPKKLIPIIIEASGISPEKKINEITKEERKSLLETLKGFPLRISSVRGFKEAIITQGGVDVKEINPSTMESKKVKGLYFAGEVLDLDAVTGGFNLQIAWSTGYLAGMN